MCHQHCACRLVTATTQTVLKVAKKGQPWPLKREEIPLLGRAKSPHVASVLSYYNTSTNSPGLWAAFSLSQAEHLTHDCVGNTLTHKLYIPDDMRKASTSSVCVQSAFMNESSFALLPVSGFSSWLNKKLSTKTRDWYCSLEKFHSCLYDVPLFFLDHQYLREWDMSCAIWDASVWHSHKENRS